MSLRVTVSGAGRLAARLGRLADQVEWAVQAAVEEVPTHILSYYEAWRVI